MTPGIRHQLHQPIRTKNAGNLTKVTGIDLYDSKQEGAIGPIRAPLPATSPAQPPFLRPAPPVFATQSVRALLIDKPRSSSSQNYARPPSLSPLPALFSAKQLHAKRTGLSLLLLLYLAAPHLKNKTIQPTLICPSLLSFTLSVNPPLPNCVLSLLHYIPP